MRNIFILLAVS